MSDKFGAKERQAALQDLLSKELLSDQKKIVELLKKQYGIETNQAVISRDLRRLGVTKKEIKGELFYELPTQDTEAEILKLAILQIEHNEALIVVKTHPGLAAFVGDSIDNHQDSSILGCLSGENVVFVTPKSTAHIQSTYKRLCQMLSFKKPSAA